MLQNVDPALVKFPLMSIFEATEAINTPFSTILATSFVVLEQAQAVTDMINTMNSINLFLHFQEIEPRMKTKYLIKALSQAADPGNSMLTALRGLVANSRANRAGGGYEHAEILEPAELQAQNAIIELLDNFRQATIANAATIGQGVVGGVDKSAFDAETQQKKDAVLILSRLCLKGRGPGNFNPNMGILDLEGGQWMRSQDSKGRVYLIAEKIQNIAIAMQTGPAEYQEAVRKMIKWVTLSFPNSVPLLRTDFTNQNVASVCS